MDDARQVEDRLRAEYVELLPAMHRTLTAMTTEVNHVLLAAILELDPPEQIVVKGESRIRRVPLTRYDAASGWAGSTSSTLNAIRLRHCLI